MCTILGEVSNLATRLRIHMMQVCRTALPSIRIYILSPWRFHGPLKREFFSLLISCVGRGALHVFEFHQMENRNPWVILHLLRHYGMVCRVQPFYIHYHLFFHAIDATVAVAIVAEAGVELHFIINICLLTAPREASECPKASAVPEYLRSYCKDSGQAVNFPRWIKSLLCLQRLHVSIWLRWSLYKGDDFFSNFHSELLTHSHEDKFDKTAAAVLSKQPGS